MQRHPLVAAGWLSSAACGRVPPQEPFELLARRAVQQLLSPALACKERVHEELVRIAEQACPPGVARCGRGWLDGWYPVSWGVVRHELRHGHWYRHGHKRKRPGQVRGRGREATRGAETAWVALKIPVS
jgi:hypothetical protein